MQTCVFTLLVVWMKRQFFYHFSCIDPLTYSFYFSFFHSFIHSLIHSFTHLFIYSVPHSFHIPSYYVSIHPVREGLQRPSKVEELQEEYALLLQQYEQEHRPQDKNAFARLVCKLPELARIRQGRFFQGCFCCSLFCRHCKKFKATNGGH